MSTDQLGNLAYLVLLAAALVFWGFVQNRDKLGKKLQYLMVWGLIFLGVIAAAGLWEDIRQTVRPTQAVFAEQGRIELPRAPDGHYYVTLIINDAPIRFVVDTGATSMVLSQGDAQRAGLPVADLAYLGQAQTANGIVQTAPVVLENVALGPFRDQGVTALVNSGAMEKSLLGMTYLHRFARLEISNGTLILER